MNTTSKTVLGIALAAVALLVGAYAYRTHSEKAMAPSDNATLPTNASDSSDAAIDKDTAAIDAQMQGVDQDNATVNDGINANTQPQ